ncbi:hypothetical protein ACJX0J_012846, partial [Zea mays]
NILLKVKIPKDFHKKLKTKPFLEMVTIAKPYNHLELLVNFAPNACIKLIVVDFIAIIVSSKTCVLEEFLWHCNEPRGRSGGILLGIDLDVYDIGTIDEGDFYIQMGFSCDLCLDLWELEMEEKYPTTT